MITDPQPKTAEFLRQKADSYARVVRNLEAEIPGLPASEARHKRAALAASREELYAFECRAEEVAAAEQRAEAAKDFHLLNARMGGDIGMARVSGGETYHRGASSPSYFRDLIHAQRGDFEAIQRLSRNNAERGVEQRALGNTGGTGGSGGEFAPPAWLVEDFVALARPGRVFANLLHHEPMPPGVSSVNLPRVGTGTTTAIQTTQNTALSQTDLTTNALSAGITTIGGKQVVSQQLLDQSGIPFDRVVLEDLTADYAKQIDIQALVGTGTAGQLRGYLSATSTNVQTWTQPTPTAALFYSQLAKLQGSINSTRYASPDTVVMAPRRWAWFASFTDSTGRPLVVPASGGFNSMADPGANVAQGFVGSVLGMSVYTDPNIPTTLGAGANQDAVLMFKRDDLWLWESDLRAEAFTAPYADSAGVLFRVFAYASLIPDRYPASLGQIQGTGLTTPVFNG